ncbi:hypothetical protein GBA52_014638 [Prunus armeniaca]|nr:hypothetical protein GBA52_014638 [Prunus armeniaca]
MPLSIIYSSPSSIPTRYLFPLRSDAAESPIMSLSMRTSSVPKYFTMSSTSMDPTGQNPLHGYEG